MRIRGDACRPIPFASCSSAPATPPEARLRRRCCAISGSADFEVFSAGTEPKGVNPYTVRVLAEIDVDWSGAWSKSVNEFLGQPFDYVITVCDRARQTWPGLPWPAREPPLGPGRSLPKSAVREETRLDAFRRTRTEVATRLRPFVELARRARRESPAPA